MNGCTQSASSCARARVAGTHLTASRQTRSGKASSMAILAARFTAVAAPYLVSTSASFSSVFVARDMYVYSNFDAVYTISIYVVETSSLLCKSECMLACSFPFPNGGMKDWFDVASRQVQQVPSPTRKSQAQLASEASNLKSSKSQA